VLAARREAMGRVVRHPRSRPTCIRKMNVMSVAGGMIQPKWSEEHPAAHADVEGEHGEHGGGERP
jgi:hypothetical protein